MNSTAESNVAPTANFCDPSTWTSVDDLLNCMRKTLMDNSDRMPLMKVVIFTLLYVCISIVGLVGNGLVIYVVIRTRSMRTTRNVFIVNLALSNFLLALIVVPFVWLPAYRAEFPYGSFMCKLAQTLPSTNIFCSSLTVSVISVDRYFAVVRTRLGPGRVKRIQATCIAIFIWIVSFVLSVSYLIHFDIYNHMVSAEMLRTFMPESAANYSGDVLLFPVCRLDPKPCRSDILNTTDKPTMDDCTAFYEVTVSTIMALFIYIVPMAILIIFSFLLSRFLAKNRLQQTCVRASPPVQSTTYFFSNGRPGGDTTVTAPSGGRLSYSSDPNRASSARTKRSRTTALLFAMALSNAILWLPFILVSLLIQLRLIDTTKEGTGTLILQYDDAAKLISMLSICVNPFLYGYLNTNFQKEFKSIFAKCCPCVHYARSRDAMLLAPASQACLTPAAYGKDQDSSMVVYEQGNSPRLPVR